MRLLIVAQILGCVLLSATAQVSLKIGMSGTGVQQVLNDGEASVGRIGFAIASSPFVLAGLVCFAVSAVMWLFVLSKIDVSSAYPCVALGIVTTVAAGHLVLGEPLPALKLVGVATIVVGVLIVGGEAMMRADQALEVASD